LSGASTLTVGWQAASANAVIAKAAVRFMRPVREQGATTLLLLQNAVPTVRLS
jgi:hypothetical protein